MYPLIVRYKTCMHNSPFNVTVKQSYHRLVCVGNIKFQFSPNKLYYVTHEYHELELEKCGKESDRSVNCKDLVYPATGAHL